MRVYVCVCVCVCVKLSIGPSDGPLACLLAVIPSCGDVNDITHSQCVVHSLWLASEK